MRDKATKLEEIQKCTLKLSALPFVVSLFYRKYSKIYNTFLFLFSIKKIKCWFSGLEVNKMLLSIAKREDAYQTASSEAV